MVEILKKVTMSVHALLTKVIRSGDHVADATCGNGNDTLFLAQHVGDTGKVFAFDLQEVAIEKTKKLLEKEKLNKRVEIHRDNHINLDQYVEQASLKAILFNLGYLPGGDHSIMTNSENTLKAVKRAIPLLAPGGLLIICTYPHQQGRKEAELLKNYLRSLTGVFNAYSLERLNRKNPPSILIVSRDE